MRRIQGRRPWRERFPSLVPLVLRVCEDGERVIYAICAGVCDEPSKENTPSTGVPDNVQQLVNGGAFLPPPVADRVAGDVRASRHTDGELTPYELRLLKLLVEGHTYKTAAIELKVSTHTVSFHLRRVYEKLHVHSKCEAVGKAMRDGLVC